MGKLHTDIPQHGQCSGKTLTAIPAVEYVKYGPRRADRFCFFTENEQERILE